MQGERERRAERALSTDRVRVDHIAQGIQADMVLQQQVANLAEEVHRTQIQAATQVRAPSVSKAPRRGNSQVRAQEDDEDEPFRH